MIRFHYRPTREDYLQLNRTLLWRRGRRLTIFASGSLLLFLLFPLIPSIGTEDRTLIEAYSSVLVLLLLPGLVVLMIAATEWSSRQRWANAPEIRTERDYEIDETGIRVSSESFSGSLAWEHFTLSEERNGLFYLSTAQNLFYFFPVAIVPDLAALKALAARKVVPSPQAVKQRKLQRRLRLVWVALVVVVIAIVLIPHSWFE